MIGPNEKIYWSGSPNKLAVTANPAILVGLALAAALMHPNITGWVASFIIAAFGLDRATASLIAFAPGTVLLLKSLWMFFSEATKVYVLTGERLVIRYGLVVRIEDEIELYRVIDVIQRVNLLQRVIGVGSVVITSNDHTGNITMSSIGNPTKVRNGFRKLAERCKSRRGVRILE